MAIRTILFDFDGTLADTLPLSFHTFKAIFHKYDNRALSNTEIVAMYGPTEDEILKINLHNKGSIAAAIDEYYMIYKRDHHHHVQKSTEIEKLLHYLREQHFLIGVITGKSRTAFEISSSLLEMNNVFDIVITGDDVINPKPDPEGILAALTTLGAAKDEAIFIGDSNADIQAGKAAGVQTIGVHWLPTVQSPTFDIEPDIIFTAVTDFLSYLQNNMR